METNRGCLAPHAAETLTALSTPSLAEDSEGSTSSRWLFDRQRLTVAVFLQLEELLGSWIVGYLRRDAMAQFSLMAEFDVAGLTASVACGVGAAPPIVWRCFTDFSPSSFALLQPRSLDRHLRSISTSTPSPSSSVMNHDHRKSQCRGRPTTMSTNNNVELRQRPTLPGRIRGPRRRSHSSDPRRTDPRQYRDLIREILEE